MNYVTKEFLIQLEDLTGKDHFEQVKRSNRAASYCRARLGADCTVNQVCGQASVESQLCPDCGRLRDCFVSEKYCSADGTRRVVKCECMHCEAVFFAYQEGR